MDGLLFQTKILLELRGIRGFEPKLSRSGRWFGWITKFGPGTCAECANRHGKIFEKSQVKAVEPPVHSFCRCTLKALISILAGTATADKLQGADYWMKRYRALPGEYLRKKAAREAGWERKKGTFGTSRPAR